MATATNHRCEEQLNIHRQERENKHKHYAMRVLVLRFTMITLLLTNKTQCGYHEVASRNWIIVTKDVKIGFRYGEQSAIARTNAQVFVFSSGNTSSSATAEALQ